MSHFLLAVVVMVSLTSLGTAMAHFESKYNNTSCPLWTKLNAKNGTCECQDNLSGAVYCSNSNYEVSVLVYHCMTYNEQEDVVLVGHCLFNYYAKTHYSKEKYMHTKIKTHNVSKLNYAMCHSYYDTEANVERLLYRTGQMCGSCEPGYGPPAYSYSIACVKCKDHKLHWLKYIAMAFLPLTVFYLIVILFRINITSGSMNGYVLVSQIMICPSQVRFIVVAKAAQSIFFSLATNFYGIWNLDFFRQIYHPFCLHSEMAPLQVLALDYLVAIYPLVLIIITYVFVKLHNRYSMVVQMWKPFYWCFARIRKEWDISKSLVGAFATFLLLSYVKILYVSSDLLAPNILWNESGTRYSKLYLYYDGTYRLFGKDHLPYALLAIFMVTVFNIVPLVLLLLYPYKQFQRCLNICFPKRELFRTFAETFHGCFKLKPYDCRCFAALYLLLRFLVLIMYAVLRAPAYYPIVALTLIVTAVSVAFTRPHKSMLHTLIDTFFLMSAGMAFLWEPVYSAYQTLEPGDIKIVDNLAVVMLIAPVYGTILVAYNALPNKCFRKIVQCCSCFKQKQEENNDLSYRTRCYIESSPLLPEQQRLYRRFN